jgi:hypothetical protein
MINYIEFMAKGTSLFSVGVKSESDGSKSTLALTNPLVGLFGFKSSESVVNVGFYQLNDQCNCLNTEFIK